MVKVLGEAREADEFAIFEGEEVTADDMGDRIQEYPLSVEVRGDWHEPGNQENDDIEFCILLTTGGPACRIMGDLDSHNQPCRAYIQYQDWGTAWTDYFGNGLNIDTLLTFCQQFYFGD